MSWQADARQFIADLFANDDKKEEATPEPKPAAYDPAAALEKIRAHLGRVGTALAAGATALLTGLGWVQLHNVFPAPANHRILVPLIAFLSSAAALIGVGWLLRTIYAAQRRIPIVSDTDALGDLGSLNNRERSIRKRAFDSVADEHGGKTLRALELRAREAEREAEGEVDDAKKKRLLAEATRLNTAVENGLAGAAALILEERSGNVFRGKQSIAAFILAALGIIVAFGVADYSKGQRDLIALRKSCAEAAAAGAKDPCASIVEDGTGGNRTPTTATRIAIGVRGRGSNCAVSVRVNNKRTRATKIGLANLVIKDRSTSCGVRLGGGGLTFASGWRHMGISTVEARLKQLSYSIVMLHRPGSALREKPIEPLAVGP